MAAKKSKKKTAKKASKKPAKVKKAPWIREYLAKHPDAKLPEVQTAGKKAGLEITQYNYTGVKYGKGKKAPAAAQAKPKASIPNEQTIIDFSHGVSSGVSGGVRGSAEVKMDRASINSADTWYAVRNMIPLHSLIGTLVASSLAFVAFGCERPSPPVSPAPAPQAPLGVSSGTAHAAPLATGVAQDEPVAAVPSATAITSSSPTQASIPSAAESASVPSPTETTDTATLTFVNLPQNIHCLTHDADISFSIASSEAQIQSLRAFTCRINGPEKDVPLVGPQSDGTVLTKDFGRFKIPVKFQVNLARQKGKLTYGRFQIQSDKLKSFREFLQAR